MTTPRDIYERQLKPWAEITSPLLEKGLLEYGEACWNAALQAAANAPSGRPDFEVKAIDIAYSEGVAVKLKAIWDLMIGQPEKPEGNAPAADSQTQSSLDGALYHGFKLGLRAALDVAPLVRGSHGSGTPFFDGIVAKENAILQLMAEPKDVNREFGKAFADALLERDSARKPIPEPSRPLSEGMVKNGGAGKTPNSPKPSIKPPSQASVGTAFDSDPDWKNAMELAAGNGYHRGRRDAAQEFQTFIVSLASKYTDEQFRYIPPWARAAHERAEQDIKQAREKEAQT